MPVKTAMRIPPEKWWATWKTLLVPTISAFLSFIFVVIRPLSDLGGEYAFLVYTTLILFFFPSNSIVVQVETTVLGVAGSTFGLAWSCATLAVAAYCGRTYGPASQQSNAVIGISLALLSLICGFVRSWAPRLTAASRIALFFPIFLLTANTDVTEMQSAFFLDQFYVTCFAAAFALFPVLLFAHDTSSRVRLGELVTGSLKTASELLPVSLSSVIDVDLAQKLAALEANLSGSQNRLAKSLKDSVTRLDTVLHNYSFEFARSRLRPTTLHAIVKMLQRLSRNPLLGPTSHVPGERIQHALNRTYGSPSGIATPVTPQHAQRGRTLVATRHSLDLSKERAARASLSPRPKNFFVFERRDHSRPRSMAHKPTAGADVIAASRNLVDSIQKAMRNASRELCDLCGWQSRVSGAGQKDSSVFDAKDELEYALSRLQQDLASLLDHLGAHRPKSKLSGDIEEDDGTRRDHFRLAFYMTSLLDLAKDVLELLDLVIALARQSSPTTKWFFPQIPGFSRFRKDPGSPHAAERALDEIDDERVDEEMIRQDEEDFTYNEMDFATASLYRTRHTPSEAVTMSDRIVVIWRRAWDHPRVVRGRIVLSRFLNTLKTSPHIYFAIKLAGGISLLAIPAYLSPGSRGREWYDRYRGAWAVVSYMFVFETHTGAIFKVGIYRFLGTFFGAVAAFVCSVIAKDNPYALVVLATALSIPISYLVLMTRYPVIGVVAGITLPPLLFITFLGHNDGQSRFEVAWTRFVEINIGIVAAVLVGSFIWPNHARVRYFQAVSLTFERATEYYLRMSRDLLRPSLVYQGNARKYNRLESELRTLISSCRLLISIQRKEVSLLPRPIKLYAEVIDAADRLVETLGEIRLLRFSVPRQTAVFDVMPLRRELISAILINLWALNQCFRSRSPLPQYLPSPRVPLEGIMAYMDELARSSRRSHGDAGDGEEPEGRDQLGILYGMAENEALGEACAILEELVAAAGTLFGTRTFLGKPRDPHPSGDTTALMTVRGPR